MSRKPYTPARAARDYLRDLAVDIRCARRDGLPSYAAECVDTFRTLWPRRHAARIDRYGVPS